MSAKGKRRRAEDEQRCFNERWTEDYFFVNQQHAGRSACMCLICNETVAVRKEFNVKRHDETKHEAYSKIKGQLRMNKINALQKNLVKEQSVFTKWSAVAESNTQASFAVSALIGKQMKPFSDGEFIKHCIMAAVHIVCPEKKHVFADISLSARTVSRRIEDLSSDVKQSLKDICRNFEFYSIALDESTDIKDTAQLAVFVRGVNSQFDIVEDFARLYPLKDTTTGEDIFEAVKLCSDDMNLEFKKIVNVTTDGAPSMVGTKKGVVALIENHMNLNGIQTELVKFHCIIHQQDLCAKSASLKEVKLQIRIITWNWWIVN